MNRSQTLRYAVLAALVGSPAPGAALYWDSNGPVGGAGSAPAGTWGVNGFWNDQADGGGAGTIGAWQPGSTAVFAAGADAVGTYTVAVSGSQLIGGLNLEEGAVTFTGGTIDMGPAGATFDTAAGITTISSIISGARLTKTGGGTIQLGTIINQFNTFTGGVDVNGGTVQFQGEAASVGNTNNPLGVIPTTVVADHIRLDNGATLSSTRASTGGSVFVVANRGIQLGAGGGTIELTDATINNSLFYAGVIAGTGALTKTGPGTIQLQGTNTYQGDTYAVAGGLGVNGTATFGSGAGMLHLDGGSIVAFATRTDSNRIANPIAMSADTIIRNTSTQSTGVRLLPFENAINATGGTLTIRNVGTGSSNFTVRLHADNFSFARPIVIDHGVGINTVAALECITDNPAGVSTFSGVISGNGSVIRNAMVAGMGGSTELLAPNTYTGGTIINRGSIGAGHDNALGFGPIMFGSAGSGDDPQVGLYAVAAARDLSNDIAFNLTTHLTVRGSYPMTFSGTVNLASSTRQLTIDNSQLTISNSITGGGSAGITKDGTGTLVLAAANTYPGPTTVTQGKLVLSESFSSLSPIDVQNDGEVELTESETGTLVLRVGAIALGPSGRIDLKNNKLITTDTVASVTALIASGRSGNSWTGAGLVTSQSDAINSNFTTLAVASGVEVKPESATDTALWAGQTITAEDTLVMYTYGGDANLDGKLNIDDYVRIDQGLLNASTGWSNGDFNYDGKINIDDYTTVIDSNIGNQNGFVFPTSGGAGNITPNITAVPEVGTAGVFAASLLMCGRYRVRRPRREAT